MTSVIGLDIATKGSVCCSLQAIIQHCFVQSFESHVHSGKAIVAGSMAGSSYWNKGQPAVEVKIHCPVATN